MMFHAIRPYSSWDMNTILRSYQRPPVICVSYDRGRGLDQFLGKSHLIPLNPIQPR